MFFSSVVCLSFYVGVFFQSLPLLRGACQAVREISFKISSVRVHISRVIIGRDIFLCLLLAFAVPFRTVFPFRHNTVGNICTVTLPLRIFINEWRLVKGHGNIRLGIYLLINEALADVQKRFNEVVEKFLHTDKMLVGSLDKLLLVARVLGRRNDRARIKLIRLCAVAYLEALLILLSLNAVHIVLYSQIRVVFCDERLCAHVLRR